MNRTDDLVEMAGAKVRAINADGDISEAERALRILEVTEALLDDIDATGEELHPFIQGFYDQTRRNNEAFKRSLGDN